MRRLSLLAVVFALLVLALPAQAAATQADEALKQLQRALGSTRTISGGEGQDVLAALEKAAQAKPALLQEMAILVVVARPDLTDGVKALVARLNPVQAAEMLRAIETASVNPTVDQLAALAQAEGSGPASNGGADGESPLDDTDLGWAGFGPGPHEDGSSN